MAAVTEVEDRILNVEGALLTVIQKVTVVTTGDTWTPGLRSILACGTNDPGGITKAAPDTADPPAVVMTGTGTNVLAWAKGYP
jgi:hypothetical protein